MRWTDSFRTSNQGNSSSLQSKPSMFKLLTMAEAEGSAAAAVDVSKEDEGCQQWVRGRSLWLMLLCTITRWMILHCLNLRCCVMRCVEGIYRKVSKGIRLKPLYKSTVSGTVCCTTLTLVSSSYQKEVSKRVLVQSSFMSRTLDIVTRQWT